MKPEENTFKTISIQTTYKCQMACANCYLGDMLNNKKYKDIVKEFYDFFVVRSILKAS